MTPLEAARKRLHQCIKCGTRVIPGRTLCTRHLRMHREAGWRHRAKRQEETEP